MQARIHKFDGLKKEVLTCPFTPDEMSDACMGLVSSLGRLVRSSPTWTVDVAFREDVCAFYVKCELGYFSFGREIPYHRGATVTGLASEWFQTFMGELFRISLSVQLG